MFSEDGLVPICISCIKKGVINEDGTVNEKKLKTMCQRIDKPFYVTELDSAWNQTRLEFGYLSNDEISKMGDRIVGYYFKNINSLRQNANKSYADSEKDGFVHQKKNYARDKKRDVFLERYDVDEYKGNTSAKKSPGKIKRETKRYHTDATDFKVTDEMIELFGDDYTTVEYKKMWEKYNRLKLNYTLQTNLHQEALATYVRFKVKEEIATANGNVDEAKKWYDAAQNAADKAKLTPKQLTQSDLHGGINSFSEIFKAVEQAVDVVPILPSFKYRPNDACDFIIWCYVNYIRDLQGLPQCEYQDIYKFYDRKKKEYIAQYGDPYGIFDDDPTEELRPNIEKFITLPSDYNEAGDGQ